jgi:release factor glutamine methyltransferase
LDSPNSHVTLQSVLTRITYRIKDQSETAGLDAQVLLASVLGQPRTWILAHPEAGLTQAQAQALEAGVQRLERGEPLPYVLGRWEFYGLEFEVGPQALIPRPETELLVENALAWLRSRPGRCLAADVGTGSGCIAVSMAANHGMLDVLASDFSLPALRLAARNTCQHDLQERILCVQADLLPTCSQRFDLVCANLPYIPSATLAGLPVSRWEPRAALDGGLDGLDAIRRLLAILPDRLTPGGLALLEIEAGQGETVHTLALEQFPGSDVAVVRDLAGRDRLVKIQTDPVHRRAA